MLHVQVRAHRRGADAVETTQRSRSFLFTAMGYAAARALQAKRISFYENGVISHNLPISPQVIGTMATRTTHPQTLQKLGRLLDLLGEHIPLGNPYEWLTKREVVERIATHGEAEQIKHAVTIHIAMEFRKRGGRKIVVTPDGAPWAPRPRVDNAMVNALARAFRWQRMLNEGVCGTIEELARRERVNRGYVSRVLRLTLLAPDILDLILDGRQPDGLRLEVLLQGFPLEWDGQRNKWVS